MFLQQTPPVSGDQPQALQQEEQGKSTSGTGEAAAGWQGWLTGWYSWYGTDTTDGLSGGMPQKDANPMFMGEPPTTKGSSATIKLPRWLETPYTYNPGQKYRDKFNTQHEILSSLCTVRLISVAFNIAWGRGEGLQKFTMMAPPSL